jgi:hypothetical protein
MIVAIVQNLKVICRRRSLLSIIGEMAGQASLTAVHCSKLPKKKGGL